MPGGQDRARRDRLERDARATRAKSLPRPPGSTPSTPSVCLQRAGDRADQAVAAERHRYLAGAAALQRELAGVLEAAGELDVMLEAEAASASCTPVKRPPGAAAAGERVDDQRQHQSPSTSASEVLGDRHRRGVARPLGLLGACVTPREHDRAVEPGGGRAGQIGVEPVADHQRPARPEAVERGRRRSAGRACRRARAVRSVAYSSAATIAPVPGHIPSSAGKVRSRPAAIISAPASTACVASRSSSKSKSSCPATTTTSASGLGVGAVDDRAGRTSATWRKIAGEPIT